MSPRRMDISSLLRDPSPPRPTNDDVPDTAHRNTDRPRTIDALLHPHHHPETTPASLLAILNSPSPSHRTPRTAPTHSPPSISIPSPHHPPASSRPPFLGLDALVHVASEERRRISALSDRDTDIANTYLNHDRFTEHDNLAIRPTLTHDHDWPSRHYSHPLSSYPAPLHRHPDLPSPFQDSARPHKRARDSPPRSPSPEPRLAHLTSPSARLHSSANPINNYPTLRRQLIDPTSSRSTGTPALLAVNDTRSIPHQHTSPFLHSLHPLQLPPHPSPRNTSHSPQHLRSHHHSSPIQTPSLLSPSAEPDSMSPRYNHGPRMAGGIEVLSNNSPSIRDSPRHDLSNYQSPGRDISAERFVSDSRLHHDRHEHSKLSPRSGRAFSPDDDDIYPLKPLPYQVQGQENVLLRERLRPRPPHLPLHPTTDMGLPGVKTDSPGQPPPDRHPIRVWEEQPTVRERSRRVSSARTPGVVCDLPEGRSWSGENESGQGERPVKEGRGTELRPDVAEDVPTPPLFTSKRPPPPRAPISEPSPSDSRPPIERNSLDSQPLSPASMQPHSPVQSEPQTHPPQTLHPDSSTPGRAPASPVLDLHPKNSETQSEVRPDMLIHESTCAPLTSSGPNITEPFSGETKQTLGVVDADDILMANPLPRQPSPEPAQRVLAKEVEMLEMSNRTHITVSQSTSESPSQHPLPIPLPTKDERSAPPEDVLITALIPPEPPSRRSPEPEYTSERELLVSERSMMDVDEELLSLVEDRPVRPDPTSSRMQVESRSPLPIVVGQGVGAVAEQGSSEASDGPSLVLSSQPVLKGPSLMTDEDKDRASMPPPAARNKKAENDKASLIAATATGGRKKKDGTPKPAAKPKQPPKPRAKPAPKTKAKPNVVDPSLKSSLPKGAINVNARSRSTSVIPSAVDDIVPEPDADNSDKEDDKLYCVCKTRYDEDRMMIACDRCDEWFHTLCVNMPDLEIDLVDQFICPPCIQKHPHLRTTWKRRCLFGLQHENPASSEACHRPSRGAFSKYCSDDCGIKYMRAHIAHWENLGGARDRLWENVKNAAKREGVVVCAKTNRANSPGMMDVDSNSSAPKPLDSTTHQRVEREIARLSARLEEVVKEHEFMKRELDMVMWREKVVELASERAAKVDECGWDQRLCFGEEEWADFGREVLESYEEARVKVESGDDALPLDAASGMHGEWWCTGKKKCERHAGWQKLRVAEVSFDKETKEGILFKLTAREREIRKCIEDILYPQPTGNLQAPSKPLHPDAQLNGLEKLHVSERGKKRSSES